MFCWIFGWFISVTLLIIKEIIIFSSISGIFGSAWLILSIVYGFFINGMKALISSELTHAKKGSFEELKIKDYTIYKKDDELRISKIKKGKDEKVFIKLKDKDDNKLE
jgi:hypothetical protein